METLGENGLKRAINPHIFSKCYLKIHKAYNLKSKLDMDMDYRRIAIWHSWSSYVSKHFNLVDGFLIKISAKGV